MAKKTATRQTGRSRGVYNIIKAVIIPGADFGSETIIPHTTQFTRQQIAGAMNVLSRKGLLEATPLKGVYRLPKQANGYDPHEEEKRTNGDPETVVIDELLNAMAKAEPILRKWRAIQKVLREVV